MRKVCFQFTFPIIEFYDLILFNKTFDDINEHRRKQREVDEQKKEEERRRWVSMQTAFIPLTPKI